MQLFTIGDLHLSIGGNKPMDKFGVAWENHAQKLRDGFSCVKPEDTTVICGDLSWGMNFEESREDFRFIDSLPGKKIILKGNHDYWWSTASKAYAFFEENGFDTISILNNNCYFWEEYAICGTRGWSCDERDSCPHDDKIRARELLRLETSLKEAGDRKKLVFLHYPPKTFTYECTDFTDMISDYKAEICCYGHLHGKSCGTAFNSYKNSTKYMLVSADYVNFRPVRLFSTENTANE